MNGYFSLVLHTHMPYVRRNGVFPVGEDWLYQVMSESYLPLIEMLTRLEYEGCSSCLSLTLTPVLCEQLADRYIRDRFVRYLKTMSERAAHDAGEFVYFGDDARRELAEAYKADYEKQLVDFLSMDGDILAALRGFEQAGVIETVASSATHAFLPGLRDRRAVDYQVRIGIEAHRARLGRNPEGFWLPECAYIRGVEELLESEGIRYMLLDSTAIEGEASACPSLAGDSGVAALARSETAHVNVWDDSRGYPADGTYLDSTKYYHNSGLHYWSVTGPGVAIEDKDVYKPDDAQRRALDHAKLFIGDISTELARNRCSEGRSPLVLASYDTELFGHGWREGIYWIEILLRSLSAGGSPRLATPSGYLDLYPAAGTVRPRETTWGTGRDDSTWINSATSWMWRELAAAREELFRLIDRQRSADAGPGASRALRQAAREVLLMESSDWPYMVAKDRASNYATQRFNIHLERFRLLAGALASGDADRETGLVSEVEELDRIFACLDLDVVSGRGGPGPSRREM